MHVKYSYDDESEWRGYGDPFDDPSPGVQGKLVQAAFNDPNVAEITVVYYDNSTVTFRKDS